MTTSLSERTPAIGVDKYAPGWGGLGLSALGASCSHPPMIAALPASATTRTIAFRLCMRASYYDALYAARMRRPLVAACACAAFVLVGTTCSTVPLYDPHAVPQQPNKIAFSGQVCTDNPAERDFPLRVVFLVDDGAPLPFAQTDVTDPPIYLSHLVQAVRDEVAILRAPDAAFAIVRYGGSIQVAPQGGGFTSNSQDITTAAGALSVQLGTVPGQSTDGTRRLGAALSFASSLITGDELSTPRGPRSRTKYVIMLVQAGPTDDAELAQSTTAACDLPCTLQSRV